MNGKESQISVCVGIERERYEYLAENSECKARRGVYIVVSVAHHHHDIYRDAPIFSPFPQMPLYFPLSPQMTLH